MIGISIFSQVPGLKTFTSSFCPISLEVQGEIEMPKLAAKGRRVEDLKGREEIKGKRETVNRNKECTLASLICLGKGKVYLTH